MASIPLAYNFRNLRVRLATTLMTAFGIALTVAVLMGIGALVDGLGGALSVTGHPNQILLMRQGSTAELVSVVSKEKFDVVKFFPGIAKREGEPMISHEVISVTNLTLRSDSESDGNVSVRGISPMGRYLRDGLELVEGRWFTPGKREVIVGAGTHAIRAGTSIGDKIPFGRGDWEVVGVFDAGESAYNSEIWTDGTFATSDLGRDTFRSSVLVRGTDAAATQAIINRAADDQRLALEGKLEKDYYAEQMNSAQPVQFLGIFVAAIMAIGSCFAAMNTMYSAIARRGREVGILRLLGFSRGSIMISFLIESLLLALLGGLLGLLLVSPLHGLEGRIGNFVTFSETTFQFALTPTNIGIGLAFAAVMGVLGGILPANQAAGKEVLTAMRDL